MGEKEKEKTLHQLNKWTDVMKCTYITPIGPKEVIINDPCKINQCNTNKNITERKRETNTQTTKEGITPSLITTHRHVYK